MKAENDNGYTVDYTRTNNDITGVVQSYNGEVIDSASYTYDTKHNMLSAVGTDGVTTSYVYSQSGDGSMIDKK